MGGVLSIAGTVESEEPVFHWGYNGIASSDDVVLLTNDNVLFRVSFYFLKANSTFFREMPSRESVTSTEGTDSTIFIDVDCRPFKHLLDLVTGVPLTGDNHVTLHDIEELLEVGDQFGFERLPTIIMPIMHDYCIDEAWDVFVFAAKNDFLPLAIYAIHRFVTDPKVREVGIDNIDHDMFDGIPGKYTVPLIRNMTLFRTESVAADWEKVANHFPRLWEFQEEPEGPTSPSQGGW